MLLDENPITRCLIECLAISNDIAIAISSDSTSTISDFTCIWCIFNPVQKYREIRQSRSLWFQKWAWLILTSLGFRASSYGRNIFFFFIWIPHLWAAATSFRTSVIGSQPPTECNDQNISVSKSDPISGVLSREPLFTAILESVFLLDHRFKRDWLHTTTVEEVEGSYVWYIG